MQHKIRTEIMKERYPFADGRMILEFKEILWDLFV
jgi:hypothetical protein